jgi:hypothetical protein
LSERDIVLSCNHEAREVGTTLNLANDLLDRDIRHFWQPGRKGGVVDRITEAQVAIFCREYSLDNRPQDAQFEHFAAFATVRRHYDRTFDPTEIVVGMGGDTGIDAIAAIINNVLVTDVDTVAELAHQNAYIDATFLFIQAERSSHFDGNKINSLAAGVVDFFRDEPRLPRNANVSDAAEIGAAVYRHIGMFRQRPACICYYVTTGKWQNEPALEARRTIALDDLRNMQIFSNVDFHCFGSDQIQTAYNQTRNPISREFLFSNRTDLPPTPGVGQAFLGFISYSAFRSIVGDASGKEILASIFEGNVRDWQEYTAVNDAIRQTLVSDAKSRFVLMNNGITIIARNVRQANHRFTIEDFQIVNGCQTSHVVFNEEGLDDTVCIPLRLIETRDEDVIESIIHATNNQSPLKPEQLYALMSFSKKLEQFFQTYQTPHTLYYERRDGQYDRLAIEKTRIIVPANVIRAFAAMFLSEPHRTTRSYKALREKVGDEIFAENHRLEPYYAAAYGLYKLERLFRNDERFPSQYKPARYHVLLAVRLLVNPAEMPRLNSREATERANEVIEALWRDNSDELILSAVTEVDRVAGFNMERDHIRQKPVTDALLEHFGLRPRAD